MDVRPAAWQKIAMITHWCCWIGIVSTIGLLLLEHWAWACLGSVTSGAHYFINRLVTLPTENETAEHH